MRNHAFVNDEIYHVYNQGVDGRHVIGDQFDIRRLLQSLEEFNSIEPIGSIYESSIRKQQELSNPTPLGHLMSKSELVEIICYCFNPNHFHLILKQVAEKGVEKFMQKFGNGYTKFFNNKYKRRGSLFQGTFKSTWIVDDEQLLRMSVYVNRNYAIHRLDDKFIHASSWEEYINNRGNICEKSLVLDQFSSGEEYYKFAEDLLPVLVERKDDERELRDLDI